MRIQMSNLKVDEENKNILVKEYCKIYKSDTDKLDTSEKIVKIVNELFQLNEKAEEYLYLLCMNARCKPISFFEVSHGTHNQAMASGREVMIRALLCEASCIVLIHNHSSGEPEPSR